MGSDLPMAWWITVFCAGALVVFFAGRRLPVAGKVVAARIGIGDTAMGLFVLALITSLPELAVTFAAMLEGAPNLALGNILGSNNFNITIVAVLELVFAGGVFLRAVDTKRYSRTSWMLLGLTTLVGLGVISGRRLHPLLPALLFSPPIVAIFVLELMGGGRGVPEDEGAQSGERQREPGSVGAKFIVLAVLVVAAGVMVSLAGKRIAEYPIGVGDATVRLGQTFVGTIFVAIATSLPEVTVALAAVREARSEDMALGTLLGSNSINILLFALGAPFLLLGTGFSAWSGLSLVNIVNVVGSLVLTGIVFVGIRARLGGTLLRVLYLLMIPIYLTGLYLVYRLGVA